MGRAWMSSPMLYSYHLVPEYAKNTHIETKCFSVFAEYLLDFALTQVLTSLKSSAVLKPPGWWGGCSIWDFSWWPLTITNEGWQPDSDPSASTAFIAVLPQQQSTYGKSMFHLSLSSHKESKESLLRQWTHDKLEGKSVHSSIFFSLKGLIHTLCAGWENCSFPRITILFSNLDMTRENQCTLVSPDPEL